MKAFSPPDRSYKYLIVQAIVDDSNSCPSLADHIAQKYSTLDMLVNCARPTTPVDHANLDELTRRAEAFIREVKKGRAG